MEYIALNAAIKEMEYIALNDAIKKISFIRELHAQICKIVKPAIVFEDNSAAIRIAEGTLARAFC